MAESFSKRIPFIAFGVVAIQVVLVVWTATRCSPTFDESAYLPAGIGHWQTGRFELYRACPPLVRCVAALPLLATDVSTDWGTYVPAPGRMPVFDVAHRFVAANGRSIYAYMTLARIACLPFCLLGAWVCYSWASDLYGRGAGLLALSLWCFDPNITAHASLITSDVATTSFSVLVFYALWKWLSAPTMGRTLLLGLSLGLLLLTRMNAILLLLFIPLIGSVWILSNDGACCGRRLRFAQMFFALVLALYVLNMGYLFEGSLRPLGDFEFASNSLSGEDGIGNRFRDGWLDRVPVPFPEDYVLGIDTLKRNFERNPKLAYLGGDFSPTGWWYYYLYGLAVKTPMGTILLVILAAVFGWRYRSSAANEAFVVIPAVCYFAFLSSQVGLNSHVRYAMPIAPFAFIFVSKLARSFPAGHRAIAYTTSLLVLAVLASSVRIAPHGLSYFHELAGGPMGGHAHLLDSNIDWGQDLQDLDDWLQQHPEAKPLGIAYFGSYGPSDVGIPFRLPPMHPPDQGRKMDDPDVGPQPGYYAISVNFLRGYRFFVWQPDGSTQWLPEPRFTYFQHLKPIARAGYSIYIYHVTDEDAVRLRRQLGYDIKCIGGCE